MRQVRQKQKTDARHWKQIEADKHRQSLRYVIASVEPYHLPTDYDSLDPTVGYVRSAVQFSSNTTDTQYIGFYSAFQLPAMSLLVMVTVLEKRFFFHPLVLHVRV